MIEYENLKRSNQPFLAACLDRFQSVFQTGQFILGPQVKEFEDRFAAYCGSRFCVGTANGMDALMLALKSFHFDDGREVIVPANTYIASIMSILNAGLKPVLVEPDLATYNIDPDRIEPAITKNTVAIMAVHLYGSNIILQLIQ